MKSLSERGARVLIVVIAAMVVALVYADAQSSIAERAAAVTRVGGARPQVGSVSESEAVEAEIARTGVVGKLEAAMGSAFGGVWFEPSVAQLHVGVTSPASRRQAEGVAAQLDLAGNVTETPVRFTWAQLEAAQERWNSRLAGLFARGEVATALAPDDNSVEVRLSPSVPSAARVALEHDAAADQAEVSVAVEPTWRFPTTPAERCSKFISLAANCDPTIVAGVSIKGEASSEKKGDCTSGPAVIRQDRSTTTKATETFLLTAGHCIKDLGGNGKKWIAFNKAGEEKEIGKAFEYLFPTIPGVPGVDIGVIKVESNVWAKAEDPPLNPEHTEWEAAAETDPTSVTASADPVKGTNSCFSGQRSGLQCGTVKNAKMQAPVETSSGVVVTVESVAEVELATGKGGAGDSGAPFFSFSSPTVVQGTFVSYAPAKKGEKEGEFVYFQLLSAALAKLPTKFDVLTTQNAIRHP